MTFALHEISFLKGRFYDNVTSHYVKFIQIHIFFGNVTSDNFESI